MLSKEAVRPEKLAYDRPSNKLIGFCAKHYGLRKYVPQNNKYVVFDAYWGEPKTGPLGLGQAQSRISGSAFDRFSN